MGSMGLQAPRQDGDQVLCGDAPRYDVFTSCRVVGKGEGKEQSMDINSFRFILEDEWTKSLFCNSQKINFTTI